MKRVQLPSLRIGSYRYYFSSYDCREPRHMHVDRGPFSAKLRLDPDIRIADNVGYSRRELREIERIAREYLEELRHAWDTFCSDA